MQNLNVRHLDLKILVAVHTLIAILKQKNQPQQTKPPNLQNFKSYADS